MNHTAAILSLHDAGKHPAEIAASLPVSLGYVYGVLRQHRSNRTRKARTSTSDTPRMVRGLAAQGIVVERIAVLVGCSRAYVYRILGAAK
jgi:transposase